MKEIIDMINDRNLLYEQYLNSQGDADFTGLKAMRNKVISMRKQAKKKYFERYFVITREIQELHGKLSMSLWEIKKIVSRLTLV